MAKLTPEMKTLLEFNESLCSGPMKPVTEIWTPGPVVAASATTVESVMAAAKGLAGEFAGIMGGFDRMNRNRRVYTKEVWEAVIDSINGKLGKQGKFCGAVDHRGPFEGGNQKHTVIMWREAALDENTHNAVGGFDIVKDHSDGRDLMAQINAGMHVGFSTSGLASAHEADEDERKRYGIPNDGMYAVIIDKWECQKCDAVDVPAWEPARIIRRENASEIPGKANASAEAVIARLITAGNVTDEMFAISDGDLNLPTDELSAIHLGVVEGAGKLPFKYPVGKMVNGRLIVSASRLEAIRAFATRQNESGIAEMAGRLLQLTENPMFKTFRLNRSPDATGSAGTAVAAAAAAATPTTPAQEGQTTPAAGAAAGAAATPANEGGASTPAPINTVAVKVEDTEAFKALKSENETLKTSVESALTGLYEKLGWAKPMRLITPAETQTQFDALNASIENLKNEKATLTTSVTNLTTEKAALEGKVQTLTDEKAELTRVFEGKLKIKDHLARFVGVASDDAVKEVETKLIEALTADNKITDEALKAKLDEMAVKLKPVVSTNEGVLTGVTGFRGTASNVNEDNAAPLASTAAFVKK